MLIRGVEESDWEPVVGLLREIVRDGETYAYPELLDEVTARSVWDERPPGVTVVAVETDGTVLGSAKSGPNRPGRGGHVATASFVVSPTARGQGVGRALGEWVLDWAHGQGFTAMQFNAVVETNHAAVRLWEALGFRVIGTVPEAFRSRRHGLVGLHIMHRRLGDGATGHPVTTAPPTTPPA
ncbi:MAG: GNAT family N-acetyltransferase [Ornithinimicrobium sp.]